MVRIWSHNLFVWLSPLLKDNEHPRYVKPVYFLQISWGWGWSFRTQLRIGFSPGLYCFVLFMGYVFKTNKSTNKQETCLFCFHKETFVVYENLCMTLWKMLKIRLYCIGDILVNSCMWKIDTVLFFHSVPSRFCWEHHFIYHLIRIDP